MSTIDLVSAFGLAPVVILFGVLIVILIVVVLLVRLLISSGVNNT